MTNDEKLMQQALEALKLVTDLTNHDDEVYAAIDALRERLEQPEQPDELTIWKSRALQAERVIDKFMQPKQQEREPVAHAIVAGALFDFMGWLTSRRERLVLSSTDEAAPAADAIKDFAQMRNLSINDARVQEWQDYLATSQPEQEPVAWFDKELNTVKWKDGLRNCDLADQQPFYTTPQPRQWVGLTHDERDAWQDRHTLMIEHEVIQELDDLLRGKNT